MNLLGVGLHSYGFTEGIWNATFAFWISQGVIGLLGVVVLLRDWNKPANPQDEAVESSEPATAK